MVSATTNFYKAALHLQQVFKEQQRIRELSQSARTYYREQKTRALQAFSRYEFLFSDSYQRLQECGSQESCPDLWDLEVATIIQTGRSYEETYREISAAFDRRIREAGTINRKDPSGSLKNIKRCEKKILPLLDDFKARVKIELNNAMDLTTVSSKLATIANDTLLWPGRPVIEDEILDAYKLGDNFGTIQLNIAKKRKKKESYNDYIKPKSERQLDWKKIADIIEKTIGEFKGICEEVSKRIRSVIADGVTGELTLGKIIGNVLDIVDSIGIRRAEAMVYYEIQNAVNTGIEDRYREDGVEELEWLACSDDIVCDDCDEMDGQKFPIDNHPQNPAHPRCRCSWIPIIKIPGDDEEK